MLPLNTLLLLFLYFLRFSKFLFQMNQFPIQRVDFFVCLIVLLVDIDVALLLLQF